MLQGSSEFLRAPAFSKEKKENAAHPIVSIYLAFPGGSVVENPPAEGSGSVPGLGRSPGGGHGNPLQCSCLENPMDRGACGLQSTGPQSQTGVSSHACIHLSPHPLSVYMQTERDIDTDASLLGGCSGPTGRTAWRTPAAGPPAPARSSPLSQPPVPSVTEADELGVWLRL